MTKNILVYDATKGFSRLINYYFKKKYTIVVCNNNKNLDNLNLSNFDTAFVIINRVEDLIFFIDIFSKVENVFFSSTMNEMNQRMTSVYKLTVLDLSMNKDELIKWITFKLSYNANF